MHEVSGTDPSQITPKLASKPLPKIPVKTISGAHSYQPKPEVKGEPEGVINDKSIEIFNSPEKETPHSGLDIKASEITEKVMNALEEIDYLEKFIADAKIDEDAKIDKLLDELETKNENKIEKKDQKELGKDRVAPALKENKKMYADAFAKVDELLANDDPVEKKDKATLDAELDKLLNDFGSKNKTLEVASDLENFLDEFDKNENKIESKDQKEPENHLLADTKFTNTILGAFKKDLAKEKKAEADAASIDKILADYDPEKENKIEEKDQKEPENIKTKSKGMSLISKLQSYARILTEGFHTNTVALSQHLFPSEEVKQSKSDKAIEKKALALVGKLGLEDNDYGIKETGQVEEMLRDNNSIVWRKPYFAGIYVSQKEGDNIKHYQVTSKERYDELKAKLKPPIDTLKSIEKKSLQLLSELDLAKEDWGIIDGGKEIAEGFLKNERDAIVWRDITHPGIIISSLQDGTISHSSFLSKEEFDKANLKFSYIPPNPSPS